MEHTEFLLIFQLRNGQSSYVRTWIPYVCTAVMVITRSGNNKTEAKLHSSEIYDAYICICVAEIIHQGTFLGSEWYMGNLFLL